MPLNSRVTSTFLIVTSILKLIEAASEVTCNNNNSSFSNKTCSFSGNLTYCQHTCGNFNFTHSPTDGLTIWNWDQALDNDDLTVLSNSVDLGDTYENSTITINVCCYNGSYSDLLRATHVTNLKTLVIDGHVTETSLTNFSSLPFQVQELSFINGENLPSKVPSEGFSSTLKNISISQMKIAILPADFFSGLTNLTSVTIQDNRFLTHIILPQDLFRNNVQLEIISITDNECLGDQCSANFDEYTFYYFTKMKEFTFKYPKTYPITFKDDSFEEMLNLTKLSLAGVSLPQDLKAIQHLKNLRNFNLQRVKLSGVNVKHVPCELTQICLDDKNVFNCSDCVTVSSLWTLQNEHRLVVKEDCDNEGDIVELAVMCNDNNNNVNLTVYDADKQFCLYNWLPFAISLPIIVVCLIVIACYFYIRLIKVTEEKQMLEENTRVNDAFISFENQDENFVKELQVELEDKNHLKCLIHSRDFIPGERIMKNISDAVESSRAVVIILSKNFLGSSFCEHELSQAISQRRRILMVMRGSEHRPSDQELLSHDTIKSHVREFTYLEEEDRDFVRKLVEFVKGNGRFVKKRHFVLYLEEKVRGMWKGVMRLAGGRK